MKKVSEHIKAVARKREKAHLVQDRCTVCKRNNPPDANFCNNCGATFLTEEEMAPRNVENTTLEVTTTCYQHTFLVDITDAKCLKYGFRHGDRAVDRDGYKLTIMGVAPAASGRIDVLWYQLDDRGGMVSFWSSNPQKTNLREQGFRLLSEAEAEANKTK
ncbi:MAG: zinc ribbon domain-containing protein [Patescibacteria group bacterium]|nr:zinc ribbon domain-containing protein [Patescibacteria group bacterium]